jgi:hypothetical protein
MKSFTILWLSLVLLIAGCATHEPTGSRWLTELPRQFKFSIHGAIPPSDVTYELDQRGIITRSTQNEVWYGTQRSRARRRITMEGWREFQNRCEQLKVARWKRSYNPAGMILDGYSWDLQWLTGDKTLQSNGSNSGPDPENPRRTIDVDGARRSADLLLEDAVDKLWAGARPTL